VEHGEFQGGDPSSYVLLICVFLRSGQGSFPEHPEPPVFLYSPDLFFAAISLEPNPIAVPFDLNQGEKGFFN